MTFTFTSWEEENKGLFTFTIKREFLAIANPLKTSLYDLMNKHKMAEYLHNEDGPAIIAHQANHREYILNGKKATDDEKSRIILRETLYPKDEITTILESLESLGLIEQENGRFYAKGKK